jgi:hypothetical protein
MYNHHEDAVRIAYYFVRDTEADEYDIDWLCDDCAAERDGDLVISGYLLPEDAKRCEDCDRPNEAALSPGATRSDDLSGGYTEHGN